MRSHIIKTPLRYPGGKSRAIDSIAPLIPEFREYREPFIGGGGVYFYIKQKYPDKKYWINDLFWELYNFWRCSQSNLDDVVDQIYQWRNQFTSGKELFRFLKSNWYRFNDLEKSSGFFILSRITFGGGILSTGYSEVQYQGRFTESAIKELSDARRLLTGAKITNLDYQKVVETHGEDVFLFMDPPYYSATESGLYGKSDKFRNTHKMFDHYRFTEVMKGCKHNWLITYDDSPFIRRQFEWANIMSWNLTYGLRTKNSNTGKELFISNYQLPNNEQTKQVDIISAWG